MGALQEDLHASLCVQVSMRMRYVGLVHKVMLAPWPFCDLLCIPILISNHSWFIHQSPQQKHLIVKQEKLGKEMATEICLWSISFILVAFFTMS
jgi:hypothetical protein